MGYILKSSDVGTLFSGRNSENSSHTHVHTHAYPCTPDHTCVHPHSLAHTPHIPTDALNLTNHMKLHVNGNM